MIPSLDLDSNLHDPNHWDPKDTDFTVEEEAKIAMDAFELGHPELFAKEGDILKGLIGFFISKFDFNVSPESLPIHNLYELPDIALQRTKLVCRFIREAVWEGFAPSFPILMRTFKDRECISHDILSHVIGKKLVVFATTILYWYLKDVYAGTMGIRARKDARNVRRNLNHYARLEISHETVHTTIDYRSVFALDYYGVSLAHIANIKADGSSYMSSLDTSTGVFDDLYLIDALDDTAFATPKEAFKSQKRKRQVKCLEQTSASQQGTATATSFETQIDPQTKLPRRNPAQTQHVVEQPEEASPNLPSLRKVGYMEILDRMLEITAAKYENRYGDFLRSEMGLRIKETLMSALRSETKAALNKDIRDLLDLACIGGEPEKFDGPGVYLHIIWRPRNPNVFWLYIGQSFIIVDRIRDHNRLQYRVRHQSTLHYVIWNSLGDSDIKSVFVRLASFDRDMWPESQTQGFQGKPQAYVLNLLEMWMCCVFQTLSSKDLHTFLPTSTPQRWAGRHLNVALPLWQKFDHEEDKFIVEGLDRVTFRQFLHSNEPIMRQWAENLRDSYNSLRDSPDAMIRRAYYDQINLNLGLLSKIRQGNKDKRYYEFLKNGIEREVKRAKRRLSVSFGYFRFDIRKKLNTPVSEGDKVYIRPFLTELPHPYRYARDALLTDPASRLLIGMKTKDSTWQGWLFCHDDRNAQTINTLVDFLEGLSPEDSRDLHRRWYHDRPGGAGTKKSSVYT